MLLGTEVKAIREGRVNLKDSYGKVEAGEVFLHNLYISPCSHRRLRRARAGVNAAGADGSPAPSRLKCTHGNLSTR